MPPSRDKKLWKLIDQILWEKWDPIGVFDVPETKDEYSGYVPQIYKMITLESDSKKIYEYLLKIEKEYMGLNGNEKKCKKIARILFSLKF